jgi:hypothetical protein
VEEAEDGRRFRTKRFEKTVLIGNKTRHGYTEVDYDTRTYRWKSWGGGKETKEAEESIPEGTYYDDPLTGFYNFRFGVYGRIEEGKEYHVPTFPKNNVSTIYVKIATNDEKTLKANPGQEEIGYLANIVIDKEFFGSQTGRIEVQFSKDMIPVTAVAKEIILFGDVKGRLAEMTSKMGFRKTNPNF